MGDSNRQSLKDSNRRTNRRTFLKVGTAGITATALAGCIGGGSGGGGGNLKRTKKIKAIEEKLPEYYPDDYWKTIARAKQEGKVSLYTAHFGSLSESYAKEFKKFYPFLDVEIVNLSTAKVFQRYSSEASQGIYTPDLVMTYDAPALSKLNNLGYFKNYKSPEESHFEDKWKSDDLTVLAPNYNPYSNAWHPPGISNPPNTLPAIAKAVEQNPEKWQSNLCMYDGQLSTSMWQTMLQWEKFYGRKTMKQHLETIATADPKSFWSTSTMGKWVATGEVQFGIALAQFILDAYIRPKYPKSQLRWQPADDIVSNIFLGGYAMAKKPSNKAAAKLFYDWYYSKRGQLFLTNTWNMVSPRDDINPSDVTATYANKKMTHKNIKGISKFIFGYDKLSKAGDKKSELRKLWYKTFAV